MSIFTQTFQDIFSASFQEYASVPSGIIVTVKKEQKSSTASLQYLYSVQHSFDDDGDRRHVLFVLQVNAV